MKRLSILLSSFALFIGSASAAPGRDDVETELRRQIESLHPARIERDAKGLVRDLDGIDVPSYSRSSALEGLLSAKSLFFGETEDAPDLRLADERESLTGIHQRYRQFIDGIEVIDGEFVISFDRNDHLRSIHNRVARKPSSGQAVAMSSSSSVRDWRNHPELDGLVIFKERDALLNVDGEARPVVAVYAGTRPSLQTAFYFDAGTQALIKRVDLFFRIDGQVFDPNPVVAQSDTSLQDNNDSADAVPSSAYRIVDLPEVASPGLAGPNVEIADFDPPAVAPVSAGSPLRFDRADDGFEDVMAYFHLDRSQRYMQSLGFVGSRRIIAGPQRVDTHANSGEDNSYFSPANRSLYFGEGGVDDAEDADILLHEYGHAIQESSSPGGFSGTSASQARAMGEGFGDYWAFSGNYTAGQSSSADQFCIGEWDARCGNAPSTRCGYAPSANCLRRVDGTKTMDDYIIVDRGGTEHTNGEIWSSALREIFMNLTGRYGVQEGRRVTDRIVLESQFGLPGSATFRLGGMRMLDVDRLLYGGANGSQICAALTIRKIISSGDCDPTPKGDATIYQSPEQNIAIPDASTTGITSTRVVTDTRLVERVSVAVKIEHPFRGDLQLVLIAPNGRQVILQRSSSDSGSDIATVYGVDSESAESLDVLRGIPANGTWTLLVADVSAQDVGRLISWSLNLKLAGDEPVTVRPAAAGHSIYLLAVAKAAGAENTNFVTDVRIFNRGPLEAAVTAFFTPSGTDGLQSFVPVRLSVSPGQTVALDDVVSTVFRKSGLGNIEFRGTVENLIISSRTYNRIGDRTFGYFAAATKPENTAILGNSPLHISQLQNTLAFRTNIGITELSGATGTVTLSIFNGSGQLLDRTTHTLLPFSHIQLPILGGKTGNLQPIVRAEVLVSDGSAIVAAYGAVVDNSSGDPIFIPAQRLPKGGGLKSIPGALHADGANDTHWRTDLWLFNQSDRSVLVGVRFLPSSTAPSILRDLTIAAGEVRRIDDAVLTLFGESNGTGQIAIEGMNLGDLLATTRTWTPAVEGSYGQFIPARLNVEASSRGSAAANAIQLESSDRFRTNVGFAEVRGQAAVVRVVVLDAGGRELFRFNQPLSPLQQLQVNLAQAGAPPFLNGRVTIEVIEGSGEVIGYAAVVDNASGDPIYVPAE